MGAFRFCESEMVCFLMGYDVSLFVFIDMSACLLIIDNAYRHIW